MSKPIIDIPPENRKVPEFVIGNLYFVCFEAPVVKECRLIDVFDSRFGTYIYILTKDGTHTIRPYCIGETKEQALKNLVVDNSFSIDFSKLVIKRPYIKT